MKGLQKLLGGLLGGMKDDKGLFQGGEEGRMFGRVKDRLSGRGSSIDPGMEEDYSKFRGHAREFAKNMDISNKEDVFEMQGMLSKLGIGDYEGKTIKSDGMIGERTLSALRALQGEDYEKDPLVPESFDYEPGKNPSGPDNPWSPVKRESTMMRNAGNSPNRLKQLLFGNAGGRGGSNREPKY